jgi:hypothetical protein
MHYKAQSVVEYPNFSWPFFLSTVLGWLLGIVLILLYMNDVLSFFSLFLSTALLISLMGFQLKYMRKVYDKIRKEVVIDANGVRIIEGKFKHWFFPGEITDDFFAWKEILGVELLNKSKGPIKLETQEGDFSFWFGRYPQINEQVVQEIKGHLPVNA